MCVCLCGCVCEAPLTETSKKAREAELVLTETLEALRKLATAPGLQKFIGDTQTWAVLNLDYKESVYHAKQKDLEAKANKLIDKTIVELAMACTRTFSLFLMFGIRRNSPFPIGSHVYNAQQKCGVHVLGLI